MKPFDLQKIRKDFQILNREVNGKSLVYLDNAATSQKPTSVINSLSDYYLKYNSNVHRGVHKLSVEATNEYENSRVKVANFINAAPNELIWSRNTSESLNIVSMGLQKKINQVFKKTIKFEFKKNLIEVKTDDINDVFLNTIKIILITHLRISLKK